MISVLAKMKSFFKNWLVIKMILLVSILILFIYIQMYNYIFFHSIVEIFCFMICFSIFVVALNTMNFTKNYFYISLGIGYFFIGILKIFHTLAYPHLGVIPGSDYNLAAQFYYSSRYIQALTLLISCKLLFKKIKNFNPVNMFTGYLIITVLFIASILKFRIFPICYVQGLGSTYFKIISSLLSISVLLYVAFVYWKNTNSGNKILSKYMIWYCILNAISEYLFLYNLQISSYVNMFGHIIEVIAYYLIYKGVVEVSLKRPYDILSDRFEETRDDLKLKISEYETVAQLLSEERVYREKIEKAVFGNKICLSILVDNSPVAIAVHSEGKFIFGNNKLKELLGISSAEEIIGQDVLRYFPDEYKKHAQKTIMSEYKELYTVHSGEIFVLSGNKDIIEAKSVRTDFVYEGKSATMAILWDISMSKKIEGLERDIKINKELLDQSIEFNKLVTEFFANVSHELKTPLNVIFSAIQLLELKNNSKIQDANSKSRAKYYDIVKQNCFRLLRLINNLIDLSKISSGYMNIRLENHNIVNIVESVTLSVADYVKEKEIELIFDTDVEEKIMACDVDKIERIILNLLSNAIKFTKPGDKIMVSVFDKNDKILISVKDTGIGIPKEKLDIIFERFEQVESSLSRNKYGSGIGLSLVKSFVEMQEGKIDIKSEVGVGTEFLIKLPVKLIEKDYDYKDDIRSEGRVERINIEFSDIYS